MSLPSGFNAPFITPNSELAAPARALPLPGGLVYPAGALDYNTVDQNLYVSTGTAWKLVSGSSSSVTNFTTSSAFITNLTALTELVTNLTVVNENVSNITALSEFASNITIINGNVTNLTVLSELVTNLTV